jgi:protein SCO1/2
MVLKVDRQHKTLIISCESIPGFMEAMTMPFEVRDSKELSGLAPGMAITFDLVVEQENSYASHISVHVYDSVEQDPLTARRLALVNRVNHPTSASELLVVGQTVPEFKLLDQRRQSVRLSQFRGKVVALNFIYTSCVLPNFCYRISNNFGVLQRRYKDQLGRDLVLLTITFDPQRDQPEVLAHYAHNWNADPEVWHFLTGPAPEIRRITNLFGVDFFPDEGLMNHSLHTVIIDRDGRLVANIEGNRFSADQLGDLVASTLQRHNEDKSRLVLLRKRAKAAPYSN